MMSLVQPPEPRMRIDDTGDRMSISIPAPRGGATGFLRIFLTIWLAGWTTGGVFVGAALVGTVSGENVWGIPSPGGGSDEGLAAFLIVWLLMWACGEATVAWMLITVIWGSERVVVGPDRLAIRNRPIGRQREYLLREVGDLRVQSSMGIWREWQRYWPGPIYQQGTVAFDYGAKTFSFGRLLDEAEAKQLISVINERFGDVMGG